MTLTRLLKNIFRPLYHALKNRYKKTVRYFVGNRYNESNYKQIPIIINNFNRLSYTQLLIERLEKWGYTNLYILGNNSTYPPLLEFYSHTKHKVIRLNENKGYMALWKSPVYKQFKFGYYVYTDPDVLPLESCGEDFLMYLLSLLKKYSEIEKIGLGLKIDDLPEHYEHKQLVINTELQYWKNKVEPKVYNAAVDTTFALYRPLAKGNAEQCPAYRTGEPYIASHLPWYENSKNLTAEITYYKKHIKQGTSVWSQK